MSRFKFFPLLAIASVASAIALPAGATGAFVQVGGEPGVITHPMPTEMTSSDVRKELDAWKRNPVSADGWRQVGGEVGWVFVGTNGSSKTRAAVIEEMFQGRRPIGGFSRSGHMSNSMYLGG